MYLVLYWVFHKVAKILDCHSCVQTVAILENAPMFLIQNLAAGLDEIERY